MEKVHLGIQEIPCSVHCIDSEADSKRFQPVHTYLAGQRSNLGWDLCPLVTVPSRGWVGGEMPPSASKEGFAAQGGECAPQTASSFFTRVPKRTEGQ